MHQRNALRRKLRRYPTPAEFEAFRKLRNEVARRVDAARSGYLLQRLGSIASPSRLWSELRLLGLAKAKSLDLPLDFSLNEINMFFTTSHLPSSPSTTSCSSQLPVLSSNPMHLPSTSPNMFPLPVPFFTLLLLMPSSLLLVLLPLFPSLHMTRLPLSFFILLLMLSKKLLLDVCLVPLARMDSAAASSGTAFLLLFQ